MKVHIMDDGSSYKRAFKSLSWQIPITKILRELLKNSAFLISQKSIFKIQDRIKRFKRMKDI